MIAIQVHVGIHMFLDHRLEILRGRRLVRIRLHKVPYHLAERLVSGLVVTSSSAPCGGRRPLGINEPSGNVISGTAVTQPIMVRHLLRSHNFPAAAITPVESELVPHSRIEEIADSSRGSTSPSASRNGVEPDFCGAENVLGVMPYDSLEVTVCSKFTLGDVRE